MIRSNLSVLLAEQGLKITKVSNDTGISRTTLTSLANNDSQGVQFETLNTLCQYLKTTPEQLIFYIPFDILIKEVDVVGKGIITIDVMIKEKKQRVEYQLVGDYYIDICEDGISKLDISLDIYFKDDFEDEYDFVLKAFQKLPRAFFSDLENQIKKKMKDYIFDTFNNAVELNFDWSSNLLE